jgi:DNA-binding MarR family transcriptional regulator
VWDNVQSTPASADHPAATVYTVGSDDERHTTRHTSTTPTRGRAARDRQLGRVQRKILRWLWVTEQRMVQFATPKERRDIEVYGVPWRHVAKKIEERPSAVSEALRGDRQRSLRERDLVSFMVDRSTGRVTRVKLTPLGAEAARRLGKDGRPDLRIAAEQERASFVRLHGPASGWSPDIREQYRKRLELEESLKLEDSAMDGDLWSFEGLHAAAIERRAGQLEALGDLLDRHPDVAFGRDGVFEELFEAIFVTGELALDIDAVRDYVRHTPEDIID